MSEVAAEGASGEDALPEPPVATESPVDAADVAEIAAEVAEATGVEPDAGETAAADQAADNFESFMATLLEDVAKLKEETSEFQVRISSTVKEDEALPVKEEEEAESLPQKLESEELAAQDGQEAVSQEVAQDVSMPPLKPHAGSWHHAVSTDWRSLGIAPSEVWGNADLVLKAVAQDAKAMQHASQELKANREFVMQAVQLRGRSLQYVSGALCADRAVAEAAVRQDRLALRYASAELRADQELIELAMRAGEPWMRGGQAVQSEAEELNSDKAAVHEAVFSMHPERWHVKIRRDWRRLEVAPKEVKANREFILEVVRDSWGRAFQYSSEDLRGDREIVLEAVQADGLMLQYASPELRNNIEVVHAAACQTWQALAFASEAPRADRTIIRAAMFQHWEALHHASPHLCADREFMLQAVAHHGHCLKYASAALRADRSVVLKAVRQNWEALKYASVEIQNDAELCLVASKPALCFQSEIWYPEDEQQLRRQQHRRENRSALVLGQGTVF